MRHVRLEVANRLIKSLSRLCGFRRKELERKRGRISPHDIGNVHGLGAYLRSSRDFWSTHRKNIFNHIIGVNRSSPVAIHVSARSLTPPMEAQNHLSVLKALRAHLPLLRDLD